MLRWLQLSLFGPSDPSKKSSPKTSAKPSAPIAEAAKGSSGAEWIFRPRLKQSWRLEWKRGDKAARPRLYVPKALATAPREVTEALEQWAGLAQRRRASPEHVRARRGLEKQIHAWLDTAAAPDPRDAARVSRLASRRLDRLNAKGRHHDLNAIFAAVNEEYFGGRLEARVTWSARWGGLSTQTFRKDGDGNAYALLTISRGYDHASATPEIVGGVVYHECLHVAVPPEERNGRRVVHGREFRRREREYRHYAVWRKWHAEVLPRIIRRGPDLVIPA